ncbi:hypothetical protein HK100_010384, partial [Physocladia obscura]
TLKEMQFHQVEIMIESNHTEEKLSLPLFQSRIRQGRFQTLCSIGLSEDEINRFCEPESLDSNGRASGLFRCRVVFVQRIIDYSGKVTQLEFGVFSAQEAKKLSVIELYDCNLYDTAKPGRPPTRFGVLDRRMVEILLPN